VSPAESPLWADVAFWGFAVLAVVCGHRVFRTDSMVRSAFFLLASFLDVGAILVLLAAPYLGVALLFMMTVEMMVMAVFMVAFMMNPAGLNPMNMVHQPRLAAAAGILVFVGGGAVALFGEFPDRPVPTGLDSVASLGHELLGGSMLIFETVGVTLLATMIGAVVLASRRSRFGEEAGDDGSLPPSLDPDGERYPAGVLVAQGDGHGPVDHGAMDHGQMGQP
jgi:NADH-quinone oxidoreductase subunit J